jgi:peptidoglycan/LPS O-acetylase OafA/YrhL
MSLYSLWPPILLTAAVLFVVGLPVFARLDEARDASGDRHGNIDGLRGFLAISVFFHHAAMTHRLLEDGVWELPPSHYYTLAGQGGVALFFMITGLLFWEKLLRTGTATNWKRLYVGRFFRIAPLYVTVVTLALVLVFAEEGFRLNEPVRQVELEVAERVAGLGLLPQADVDGFPHDSMALLLGVVWTLRYEWLYYFSLPVLALAARSHKHLYWVLIALLGLLVTGKLQPAMPRLPMMHFLFGMLAASLSHEKLLAARRFLQGKRGALFAVGLLLLLGHYAQAYGSVQTLILGAFFLIVASGNTLFGLLRTQTATRLGHASYGIYLAQGLVLTAVFSIHGLRAFAMLGAWEYWLVIALSELALLLFAVLSHLYIERPFIRFGKTHFG